MPENSVEGRTTPASQSVGNEFPCSGDPHPVATHNDSATTPASHDCSGDPLPFATPRASADRIDDVLQMVQTVDNESRRVADVLQMLHPVERCIQKIAEVAQADNGALLEGDLPRETRYEDPEIRMAAQDLLHTIYTCHGGVAPRTEQAVLQAMATPIRRRQEYVKTLAASRGVLHPAPGFHAYTEKDWLDWYAKTPLSEADMDAAVSQWKEDFLMISETCYKIKNWEDEGTRKSKKEAKTLRNGAFAAYLQQECIAKQLAMSFLKFPSATVHTLLLHWAQHMKSEAHAQEKQRAQKLDKENAEAVCEKQRQQEMKKKVHSLRHRIRQMKNMHLKKLYAQMTWQQQKEYEKWWSGEMHQELEALTWEFGYGTLPLQNRILLPTRFPDTAICPQR